MIKQTNNKIAEKEEKNRGITLPTLAITIIILVILASITIGMATGDDGLIEGSKRIEKAKRIEKYTTALGGVAYEQYTDYVMESKQGSLREKTKDKIETLDFVKEANNGAEDDEINVITNESYLIVVKLDNGSADVIHDGENDEEPLPKITREYVGKENDKYKIKASATVEKTEKTTAVTKIGLVEPVNTIENYEEGKEVIFEVDKPGKYWIEATTNIGKSVKESIIIEDEDAGKSSFEVMVSDKTYTYTGEFITPEVTVKDGKVILTKDTHYSVEYSDNVNAGTGKIKITGKGKYSGTVITKTFNISKANLMITAENKDMFYDGELPKLSYIGTGYASDDTSEVLTGEIKYTIKNSDGEIVTLEKKIPVGTYTIIPSGLNAQNYSITYKAGILTVNGKNIDENGEFTVIIGKNEYTYDGAEKKPEITVKDGENVLKENENYTVEYSNNINAGTGKVTVIGKGNYTGKVEKTFVINKAEVEIPTSPEEKTYNGEEQASGIKLPANANVVTANSTVKATNAGTYTVEYSLNDTENYEWKDKTTENKKVTWKINAYDINNGTIKDIDAQKYNGQEQKLEVTVTAPIPSGKTTQLVKDTDYTVEYSNNINAGTGKVVVIGKGNYTGRKETTFEIEKASLIVTAENKTMNYGGTVPEYTYTVTGYVNNETSSVLGGTVSYTVKNSSGTEVTISKTTNAGTYTITPSGLSSSNYNITYKAGTLTIGQANGYVTLDANKSVAYGTASTTFAVKTNHGGTISVSDDNSTATSAISGTTVTISNLNTLNAGTTVKVTVNVASTTNYKAASAVFTLTIGKASVTVPAQNGTLTYNKAEQSPSWSNYNTNIMTIGGTTKGTNAGSYNATFTLKNTTNYQWSDKTTEAKTVAWKIGQANGYVTLDANKSVAYGTASTTFAVKTNHGGTLSVSDDNSTATSAINGTTVTVSNLSTLNVGTTVKITVNVAATTNYKAASAVFTLTIRKAGNPIAVTNKTIYTGSTLDLSTVVSKAQGTLTYKIKTNGTTTASTLSGSKLTAGAMSTENDNNQTVVVTITAGGNTNYNSGSKDVTITVQKYTPTLAWADTTPSSIVYGTTGKTATVTATVSGGTKGAITYASGTTSVLTINASTGALTTKGVGSSVITASIARTTTVKAGSTTKTISVTKAENPITVTANTLTYNGKAQNLVTTKNAQGTVYYSVGTELTSSNYKTAGSTTVPTQTAANTSGYVIYYYCEGNGNYNAKSGNVTVKINKANATNPTLTKVTAQYDGNAHAVTVSGGSGGTIYYRTSTDNTTWGDWTTTKPSRTDVGTTYVQAYVKGDSNHNNTSATTSVTIVINKNTLTIKHYLENANDTNYTLVATTTNTTLKNGQSITLANYKKTDIANGKTYKQGSTTEGGTAVTTATMGANTTIYLYYSRDKYVLTLNKGSYIDTVTGAGTYKVGQSVKIDATLAANATGYTNSWVNWTSSNTLLVANTTTKNATITMPASAITLTANGKTTAKTVKVTFMRNLDSSDTTSDVQTFTYGVTGQKFSAKGWSKTGYTLLGWSHDSTATTRNYSVESGVSDAWINGRSPATTIYAVWQINNYTVTYNYSENGGTSATKETASVSYGGAIDLTPTATKTGYTFVGWNTNKDANTGLTSLNMGTSNVTLYAIYKKDIAVTFKYYNNQSKTINSTVYNKTTSANITAPEALGTPSGYTFRGWTESESGNAEVKVSASKAVNVTQSKTYYASYQKTVTATFHYCNAKDNIYTYTYGTTTASGIQYLNYKGAKTESTITIPDVVKSNGNYYGVQYKGVSNKASTASSVSATTANTTYYAYYQGTITYYYYNGTSHTSSTATRTIVLDGSKPVCTVDKTPTPSAYDGAIYKGWSISNTAITSRTPSGTSSASLYAYYQKTVTATFNYYNGTAKTSTTAGATRTYISKAGGVNTVNANITVPDAVKENRTISSVVHTYRGVSTSDAANATVDTPTTANTTYYASYTYPIVISFNANGGTGTAPANISKTGYMKYEGTKLDIDATLPANTFTKSGYIFGGWNTKTDGTGTNYAASTTQKFKANVTLYAKWIKAYYQNTTSNTLYATLSDAVTNSATGTQINVIDNVAAEKTSANNVKGKTLTLNLNGKTITFNGTNYINNNGELTIIGSGKISGKDANTIHNNGTLNVNMTNETAYNNGTGGIIENRSTEDTKKAIYNLGTVNINSGVIANTASASDISTSSTPYVIANATPGVMNINGGVVRGISSDAATQNGIWTSGTLNVNGGTIEAVGTAVYSGANTAANVTITGGTIKSGGTKNTDGRVAINHASTGKLEIKGTNKVVVYSRLSHGIYNYSTGICTINNANAIIEGITGTMNDNEGTININNGQIHGFAYDGVYNTNNGTINITGGTIQAKNVGLINRNNGTIKITGGTINTTGTITTTAGTTVETNSGSHGLRTYEGNVTISGGTIIGNYDGIHCYKNDNATTLGKLTITGGKIQGNTMSGIYDNQGQIITLGTNDSTVSKTTPEISGSNSIGVYRTADSDTAGGKFYFYDGIIKGKTAINGKVTGIPTGYAIATTTSNNVQSAILKKNASMTVSNASMIIQDGSSSTFTYTYDGDGAVTVKSSDTSIATCSVNTSTKTVTVNALKTSKKAATITVSAAAGTNYNATSKTVQIGAIVISGVPTSWTNKDQKVTAKTTLTGHTVQTMKDTGSWQTVDNQTFTANGTFSARVLNSSSASVGTKSVTITKIDKTAPTITRTGASVNGYVITASMTATDNSGITPTYWYNIQGGTFQTSNTFTVTSAGTYTVGYKAIDAAGNESEIQYKKVTVENTAPTTPTTSVTSRNTNTIVVNAKSTDTDGDKLTYKLYTKAASASSYTLSATSASTTSGMAVNLTASKLSGYTVYNYYVTVTDGKDTTTGTTVTTGTGCSGADKTCSVSETKYCSDTTPAPLPCGGTVSASQSSWGICSKDGTNLVVLDYTCSKCGNVGGGSFCPKCGTKPSPNAAHISQYKCEKHNYYGHNDKHVINYDSKTVKLCKTGTFKCYEGVQQGAGTQASGAPSGTMLYTYYCEEHKVTYKGTYNTGHDYTVTCNHSGYDSNTTHYYCTTHGYVGTSDEHSYCLHGKIGMHFPN